MYFLDVRKRELLRENLSEDTHTHTNTSKNFFFGGVRGAAVADSPVPGWMDKVGWR